MSLILDGTNGLTFNDATTQASTATNASNISSGTLGKARLPTGSVLQVVNATTTTSTSTSSSSFVDTTLTATITPNFSTSKILILINHTEVYRSAGNSNNSGIFNLCKNGSQIIQFTSAINYTGTTLDLVTSLSYSYLDSPATTSATTYKTQFKNSLAASQILVQNNSTPSIITLMEIAA